MGFEVTYLYHERKEDGSYDTENKKEIKKKVGSAFEDTPLEKVAGSVLSQLARRDIWVVDVKVFELVKREVNFKESKDGRGIVLKNKKFSFDGTAPVVVDDVPEAEPEVAAAMNNVKRTAIVPPPQLQAVSVRPGSGGNLVQAAVNQKRVLFKVIFEPEGQNRFEADRQKFKLTIGKQYPVHRQTENPLGGMLGSVYCITDDSGGILEIDEKFFTVAGVGLMGGEEFNRDFHKEKQPKLLYDNGGGGASRGPLDRSQIPEQYRNIPIEGEEINDLSAFQMPEIRPGFKP